MKSYAPMPGKASAACRKANAATRSIPEKALRTSALQNPAELRRSRAVAPASWSACAPAPLSLGPFDHHS